MRHRMRVGLDLVHQPPLERATILLRAAKRSRPFSASVRQARPRRGRHARGTLLPLRSSLPRIQHVDERQVVAPSDLEVVEVVGGRDLDRTGALLRIGIFVGDDRDAAADQRQDRVAADRARRSARRSGCTATAVSPSMVSGRVVATVMKSSPGIVVERIADSARDCPLTSTLLHLEIGDGGLSSFGSQLTSRLSR